MGGTALFGEFLARGRIGDIDFTAGVEPEILGQVEEVVIDGHGLAVVAGHVAVGIVGVGAAGFEAFEEGGTFCHPAQAAVNLSVHLREMAVRILIS